MWLKLRASTLSFVAAALPGTRASQLPCATSSAARASCSMGRETRAAIHRLKSDGEQNAGRGDAIGNGADVLLRLDHAGARDGHREHRQHGAWLVL